MKDPDYKYRIDKRYRWRKANGITISTSAEPVRKHIEHLKSLDITAAMIADAANISDQHVMRIADTDNGIENLLKETAARILAITHHPHPDQAFVLSVGASRRLRALNALGWSTGILADRIGVDVSALGQSARRKYITYRRWVEVRDLYEELSGTRGPSRKSIEISRRAGHVPPLAWEGIDIDDPRAQPDWIAAGIKIHDRPVCANGHRRTAANTILDHRGHRACTQCLEGQRQRAAARKKQAA